MEICCNSLVTVESTCHDWIGSSKFFHSYSFCSGFQEEQIRSQTNLAHTVFLSPTVQGLSEYKGKNLESKGSALKSQQGFRYYSWRVKPSIQVLAVFTPGLSKKLGRKGCLALKLWMVITITVLRYRKMRKCKCLPDVSFPQ